MKKKLSTLTLIACMFLFGHCNDVQAVETKASDIPNNTYMIGTHMFTDEIVLTTKHIMLGATTIESDKLLDMTIYYKTPRGAWIDGVSGETVTIPTNFDVYYIDTVLQIATPTISAIEEISNTEDLHGKIYTLSLSSIENIAGVELYYSSTEDGEYTLLKDYKNTEISDNKIEVEVKGGYNYFYKVKTYKTISEKIYSEFSNVINIDNSLLTSYTIGYGGYITKGGEITDHNRILLFASDAFNTALGNIPDGIEVYSSLEKDGEYARIRDIAFEDLLVKEDGNLGFSFLAMPGYVNYFKIRSYIKYGEIKVYSDYEFASLNEKLDTPWIYRMQGLTVDGDNFPNELYLGNVYFGDSAPMGIEVFYSTQEDGEYTLLTSVSLGEMEVDKLSDNSMVYKATINIPVGERYYIKVRNYVEVRGEKVFGEFSNIKENAAYKITYNLDGGEFYFQEGKHASSIYYGEDSGLDIAQPRKRGYIFIGWTGSNGTTPQKDITITAGTKGNLEYTANWVLLGDVDENDKVDIADVSYIKSYVEGNELPTTVNISYGDVNEDGEVDDVDAEIIQKYLGGFIDKLPYDSGEKYTITYNLNNGIIEKEHNIETYAEISLPYTLNKATKEGYIFAGWVGSNGGKPQMEVTIKNGTTGNLNYTAAWIVLGDVDLNGEVNIADVTCIRRYTSLNELPTTGNISYGDVNEDGEVDDVDAEIIQKYLGGFIDQLPYDSGEKYTITYNLDGGTELDDHNIKTYAEISLPYTLNKATKEGYIFVGWTGSNGTTPQTEVTIEEGTTGNLEYTANWKLNN